MFSHLSWTRSRNGIFVVGFYFCLEESLCLESVNMFKVELTGSSVGRVTWPFIREGAGSAPPAARRRRCSRRWRRGGRWWRRRRWPTRSTASAGSPRSCAGSAGPCWCPPRPPTGVPWSWAGAPKRAAAARSGARRRDPPQNSLRGHTDAKSQHTATNTLKSVRGNRADWNIR